MTYGLTLFKALYFKRQFLAERLGDHALKNLKAIILLTFSLAAFDTMAIGYTLKLSEAELQERVSAMMPLEKKQLFLTVVISDPQISLLPDTDQVGVFLNVDAIIASGLKGSGRGRVIGSLFYDKSLGAFFLKAPVLDSLQIDRLPAQLNQQIAKVSQAMIASTLASYPLYTLNDNDFKQKMAKSMIESIDVQDQQLLIKFAAF
jgi:Protein of unknown function (DUF1439)